MMDIQSIDSFDSKERIDEQVFLPGARNATERGGYFINLVGTDEPGFRVDSTKKGSCPNKAPNGAKAEKPSTNVLRLKKN